MSGKVRHPKIFIHRPQIIGLGALKIFPPTGMRVILMVTATERRNLQDGLL
jgi:hypothetical protein